ncbi:MAG TPA: diacylglycerol kinase [Povalibacter sp.]|nr:diacylglycerol kinase [Povalibacter sp.]
MSNAPQTRSAKNLPLYRRMGFALAGVFHAVRTENSFRFHVMAAAGVLATLLFLRPPAIWWAIMAITVGVVLAAELINTAVETLADHLHPEQHMQIRLVKDCAAAAVLIASIAAVAVAAAFVFDVILRR